MGKFIPIVISYTLNYVVPAATCVYSILVNSDKKYKFHFICLSNCEVPGNVKNKFSSINSDRAVFSYINLENELSEAYVDEKYTVAASYRLLLPSILPDINKVIYVDCDMIIRTDLGELYDNINLDNFYLAGVAESTLEFQKSYIEKIGCKPGKYINSGFMVMNLEKLRSDDIVDSFLKAINVDYLEFPDQDVINIVCQDRIKYISPKYNAIRTFFIDAYSDSFDTYYKDFDRLSLKNNSNIHYTGGKPWNCYTVEFTVWWEYYLRLSQNVDFGKNINTSMYILYRLCSNKIGGAFVNSLKRILAGRS